MSKKIIKVCMGSSCFARGNIQNLQTIEDYIKKNNLEEKTELMGLRCCNQCSCGPNISIDNNNYNNVDKGALVEILDNSFGGKDK